MLAAASHASSTKPNIIFMMADDMGYGDVQVYNTNSKIPTPNMDKLAGEGMLFTDAHSTSAVCTPTRYGVLTGSYNWRSYMEHGVVGDVTQRGVFEDDTFTLAEMLRQQGYTTSAFGKWHIGVEFQLKDGSGVARTPTGKAPKSIWKTMEFREYTRGPMQFGFDYVFGHAGAHHQGPYAFYENQKFYGDHNGNGDPEKLVPLAVPAQLVRYGPALKTWDAEMAGPTVAKKAVEFIQRQTDEKPFFMYYAASCPHGPLFPAREMDGKKVKGSTGIGPRADYIYEFDIALGMLLRALEEKGMTDNTLIVVTSDNGATKNILTRGFPAARQLEEPAGHFSNGSTHNKAGILRGQKADIWEAGHRVPFIIRWPGNVQPSSECDQLVGLHDFMATVADIVGYSLKDNQAVDSFNFLNLLTGKDNKPVRDYILNQSGTGVYAVREGNLKLILGAGAGGFSGRCPKLHEDMRKWQQWQLYNLDSDPAEKKNLIKNPEYKEQAEAMWKRFRSYRASERTRPEA